jgi:hypothetical protein
VQDILFVCADGLTGLDKALEAAFPKAVFQTCVVHLIRAALRFVSRILSSKERVRVVRIERLGDTRQDQSVLVSTERVLRPRQHLHYNRAIALQVNHFSLGLAFVPRQVQVALSPQAGEPLHLPPVPVIASGLPWVDREHVRLGASREILDHDKQTPSRVNLQINSQNLMRHVASFRLR